MVSGVYFLPNLVALVILVLAGLAEWLHARRVRAVTRLTFGPDGRARRWTAVVPVARTLSLAAIGWGLVVLYEVDPKIFEQRELAESAHNRLLIAYDVSPSMVLADAGLGRDVTDLAETGLTMDAAGRPVGSATPITRSRRAAQVVESIFQRVNLHQTLTSVVAFHTSARPVVIDARDIEVIRNIFDDLPLRFAFPNGKTAMMKGVTAALELAREWPAQSTTLLVISDGDTIPDQGAPLLPPAISSVLVVGVGPTDRGTFIDGHFSKQDVSSLGRLAQRLGGVCFDANVKNVPTEALASLVRPVALEYKVDLGRREYALAAMSAGASVFALIPVLLAAAGSSWRVRRGKQARNPPIAGDRP